MALFHYYMRTRCRDVIDLCVIRLHKPSISRAQCRSFTLPLRCCVCLCRLTGVSQPLYRYLSSITRLSAQTHLSRHKLIKCIVSLADSYAELQGRRYALQHSAASEAKPTASPQHRKLREEMQSAFAFLCSKYQSSIRFVAVHLTVFTTGGIAWCIIFFWNFFNWQKI